MCVVCVCVCVSERGGRYGRYGREDGNVQVRQVEERRVSEGEGGGGGRERGAVPVVYRDDNIIVILYILE